MSVKEENPKRAMRDKEILQIMKQMFNPRNGT